MRPTPRGTTATTFLPLVNTLTQMMNPETAFQELLNFLTDKCHADRCLIIMFDDDHKLSVKAVSNQLEGEEMDFSRGILLEAIEANRAVWVENAVEDPKFQGNPSVMGKPFLSVIAVPIHNGDEVMGALYLDRRQFKYGPFEEDDLDQVQNAADILTPILIRHEELEMMRIRSDVQRLGIFIGNSPQMERVYAAIEEAAKVDFTVSIHGETGTGKELVANALHRLSPRRNRPFVPMNCASINKELAESELFGHEKGAFTGAITTKKGKFELADGGTLFLDEMGELSPDIQAKLLRVLQERQIWRVGGNAPIDVNVRVVVATHKNLHEEVKKGNFREDLFYRLNVLNIELPPLRERAADIPLLAYHFLDRYNEECKKRIPGFSNDGIIALRSHPWTGNVRELDNHIAKIVVKQPDHQPITAKDLFPETPIRLSDSIIQTVQMTGNSLEEMIRQIELIIVQESLLRNEWKKMQTADELGISRPKLDALECKITGDMLEKNQWNEQLTADALKLDIEKLQKIISRCKLQPSR